MYGLDSAQLNETELKKIEVFQLQIIRQILKINTICVDRQNTNEEVTAEQTNKHTMNEEKNK